ncbi:intraflagellar transport protein 88 homolog isoform X2 [Leguminivora glycinivorella]|uniref:intraflagellar transport protein 88 homolog isoform X2 n=1 Tax=Leguminivora glycinivorella TaxID=1035111 RepID=UPI00200DC645|nr:intraflagellar transport protein 88 homolog isoform X2 [Leguminivora glycinivorella]
MLSSRYYSASRVGTEAPPRTAMVVDDDELYAGFNDVAPALDTRALRDDAAFQDSLRTAGLGRKVPSRLGTGMFRLGTVSVRGGSSRAGTAAARPVTAVRAAGYTSAARDLPSREERKEDTIEDKVKQMEARIMALVEESCMLSAQPDPDDDSPTKTELDLGQALAKAQEASTLERQLIRMQEQANLGDSHNLDLTFAVLCNLAGQYAVNEMYTEALNTYQLLTRNKLFPHANRLKVNMGNIYFKMGEHPKALKLYRMALDQTPTAEKDLRMKVMHNIGLLLVRMGKFRDAVTNFQHIMHEQGDFQTGLHLVLCSVALNDAEGGKAAFHAMLDVEPPTYHQDITVDDENDSYSCVVRDVLRVDRLARWSRRAAAGAERCLALAAAALQRPPPAERDDDSGGMSWCVEALRGYSGGAAGARLELGGALAALRALGRAPLTAGQKALQRLKSVARAHPADRVLRAEANADAAFVAYALGNFAEARSLSESASRDDPYSCPARVTAALAAVAGSSDADAWRDAAQQLTAASHLDPADLIAMHDLALALERSSSHEGAAARWSRMRSAGGSGGTLRALAAAGLARRARAAVAPTAPDHWYNTVGSWDAGVTCALAQWYSEIGDTQTAKHHYQDVEAIWPCEVSALEWLAAEARSSEPALALQYYRRAARLQPGNPQWGLLMGGCLRASGRYQEALSLFKKMNARFPDNVQCLKLIVKLCGDQGLAETSTWTRELQRAQARLKQTERASVPSAGSGSSGASQSPIDQFRGRAESAGAAPATPAPAPASRAGDSRRSALSRGHTGHSEDSIQEVPSLNRSVHRAEGRKKTVEDDDDDLPLPPE